MANPGMPKPNRSPMPGEPIRRQHPERGAAGPPPDELPDIGPTGPRTPYPVNDPGISDPKGPGSEPDYLPGNPTGPGTRY